MKRTTRLLILSIIFMNTNIYASQPKSKADLTAEYLVICGVSGIGATAGTLVGLSPYGGIVSHVGILILDEKDEAVHPMKQYYNENTDGITTGAYAIGTGFGGLLGAVYLTQSVNLLRIISVATLGYAKQIKNGLIKNDWDLSVPNKTFDIARHSRVALDTAIYEFMYPTKRLVLNEDTSCAKAKLKRDDAYMGDKQMYLAHNANLSSHGSHYTVAKLNEKSSQKTSRALETVSNDENN